MEGNFGPSMVEPCYNPTIKDYINNPGLVARKGYYDDGQEVSDDLPDPWSDEPLYAETPAIPKVGRSKRGSKGDASKDAPEEPKQKDADEEPSDEEKDDQ